MDDEVADEVTTIEAINRRQLRGKDNEFSLNHVNDDMLEFHGIAITNENFDRIGGSGNASASPRCFGDAGPMVEELTVKNYNDENLAIIGTSRNKDKKNNLQHSYQMAGGDNKKESVCEDVGFANFQEFLMNKQMHVNSNEAVGNLSNENKSDSGNNSLLSPNGIRTKMLSKSGFSEFFVKRTLKGKGTICRGPVREQRGVEFQESVNPKASASVAGPDTSIKPRREFVLPPSNSNAFSSGVNLRVWLKQKKMNKAKSLYIFKQIVHIVDLSHSQGVILQDLKPSCFKLSRSNQVAYIGSYAQNPQETLKEIVTNTDRNGKRPLEQSSTFNKWAGKRKFEESVNTNRQWPFLNRSGNDTNVKINAASQEFSGDDFAEERTAKTVSLSDPMEEKWYTSPEELTERCCTFSSNVYCLGILLFELLGCFESGRAHGVAMYDLQHRILPPNFLAENPKEAGFCLWLLHPQPSSRPATREILKSDVISGIQEVSEDDLSSCIDQEDTESDVLLHFLSSLQDQKQKHAAKLVEEIKFIESDIQEVEKRQPKRNISQLQSSKRNISQLESAYLSVRSNIHLPNNDVPARPNKELLRSREDWYRPPNFEERSEPPDRLGAFFNGLCKYARYSKFEVCGMMKNGEFNSSANVICSLDFDRDEDYFATAGVSKKIKIYDYSAVLNYSVDIHYPVIEMSNKSRLSCVCWNSYIKNFLASTDYEGIVKLWDAGTGQRISEFKEHGTRAWSVDFSQVNPTTFASGSDDGSVKLWNINERNSLCTVRNIANVCCVQFSTESSHLLSFGSADYKTYCYDLRNVSVPWCILSGHKKAVSFVKFLDAETLVSASTDNTLKIWDLNKTNSSGVLSANACNLTLQGHTNEKNFVGLSVADGYVVCGSETNEVYAYYKSLPMPITSHKFGSIDQITGKETDNDNGHFISSVYWRRKSDTVVAASSSGCIKLLKMGMVRLGRTHVPKSEPSILIYWPRFLQLGENTPFGLSEIISLHN